MSKETAYERHHTVLKLFSFRRIILPVVLGLLVAFFLVYRDKDSLQTAFHSMMDSWTWFSTMAVFIAICMMVIRDLAYMLRIRLLTDKKLSWSQSFQVIMLWEFASTLTPSVVGGSAVAVFIIAQEGISGGRSTAIVLITALLDELFYIVFVPIVIAIVGFDVIFGNINTFEFLGMKLSFQSIFVIGYFFIVFLTLIIIFGIFVKPEWMKAIITKLFNHRFLHRWQHKAEHLGNDIVITSNEMKGKGWWFWVKMFLITTFSWTARFAVVNFLIMALNPSANYFLVYAQQLVMWVVLLISPTPGGSGIAEFAFPIFLGDFIPEGLSSTLAIVWRLLSYYPYFIIGSIVLPIWLRRVLKNRKK